MLLRCPGCGFPRGTPNDWWPCGCVPPAPWPIDVDATVTDLMVDRAVAVLDEAFSEGREPSNEEEARHLARLMVVSALATTQNSPEGER